MTTENEGTHEGAAAENAPAVPAAPSAPPVPVAAPDGPPASVPEPAPAAAAAQDQTPAAQAAHEPVPAQYEAAPAQYEAVAAPHEPAPAQPEAVPAMSAAGAGWPPPPPAVPSYGGGGGNAPWGAPVADAPQPPKRRIGGLLAAVLVTAIVAGGVGGAVGYKMENGNNSSNTGSTTVSSSGNAQDVKRAGNTVAGVAAKALPSVVTIESKGSDGSGGTGTGFVFDKQGHILTNNHVVADAASGGSLTATFSNGKKYDAEIVGRAEGYDVAVIKLKNAPDNLVPLALGDSDKVAVGDSTIAIGAPFGLSNTVTTGIISAKNRPVSSSDSSASAKSSYMSALQTDASINPGNSGGPLLDASGAVIGINSAIQSNGSSSGTSQSGSIGLGFAIPINEASRVAQELITSPSHEPVYPIIGATVAMADSSTGAASGDGAKISAQGSGGTAAVSPNGPAAKAGLKAGDTITKLDDTVIDSGQTLISAIWTHKPGDKVTITYTRDGKQHTTQVTLGERKGDS
ncbi:S1C family serine protease [Streptomyces beijiangensis]|uniref:Trypsin-like peptidase domain-containing protein n=1 Tax=Streptomyces beijiangensis TaxID=163361 RepID=A0A939JG95_9ACTN|nr:trypsin-like peptidase domain-containing protein [Streptomyces beijiangensis]MBO0510274.1 trypsin-like peptidase domain-containing protein [Streptomyces beijiangensis]